MRKLKVFASGVFDGLHVGHIYFLKEAKKLGKELVVCVASDKTARLFGKNPIYNQNQRLEVIKALKFVDKAFIGKDLNKNHTIYDTIKEIKPDVIALGYDQKFDEKELERKIRELGLSVTVRRIRKLK